MKSYFDKILIGIFVLNAVLSILTENWSSLLGWSCATLVQLQLNNLTKEEE